MNIHTHKSFIATTIKQFLTEQVEKIDSDLNTLFELAKKFDDPYKFDDFLNRNKLGHNREHSFLRERFLRLNRGTRLEGNGKVMIYRTGDEPIKWGDYIYLDEHDAKSAHKAGQGNKIYKKLVPLEDVIETSVSGEYYYSPRKIANIADDLIDLWNHVNVSSNVTSSTNTNTKTPIEKDNSNSLKDRIKLFKKELVKLKGKYDSFDEFEDVAFNLSLKYHVPFSNYEQYFEKVNLSDNLNDNFWKWFSDSKVVDDNGNPIVCYHATKTDFKTFSFKNALQKIIWFTDDINAINNKEAGAVGYDYIKKLYVLIKKPAYWDEYNKYGLGQLEEMGFDGCILKSKDGTFNGFVFNPNQIKAVDNDGTWDISDNNIYS